MGGEGLGVEAEEVLIALLEGSCASIRDIFYRAASQERHVYRGEARQAKTNLIGAALQELQLGGLVTLDWSEAHAARAASLTKRGKSYAVGLQAIKRGIERAREAGVFEVPAEGD